MTEFDQSGNWVHTNIYAAGQLLATYNGSGLHFSITDPLGSVRVNANGNGVLEQTCTNLPFGDQLNCSGSTQSPTEQKFTGKERDTESGLDYFVARYYGSTMGRMTSPDPSGLAYADPENPQSFNLYSYVLNNPLTNTDPTGMTCQKNSSDGTIYDDNDGLGCSAVDEANAKYQEEGRADMTVTTQMDFPQTQESGQYLGNLQGTQSDQPPSASHNGRRCIATCGKRGGTAPDNGPHYSMADVCAASTLLNKGGATALDLLGAIPGENTLLKGAQFLGGLVSAGMTIVGNSSPTDAVFTGVGSGITAVDVGKVMTAGAKAVPIVGNVVSGVAAINDVYGKEGMGAYYDDCMAGKN